MLEHTHPSSFRDPSGFIFMQDGVLCRSVDWAYKENYDLLISSGLYEVLTARGFLVKHSELETKDSAVYKVLQPEFIDFISYPYEWSFSQLKDAALLTLEIQKQALKLGMVLKDASAYNVQFRNGKPIFIDTLSFEKYKEGEPWVAYKQFCQHFLASLALMSLKDIRLNSLLKIYIDGIPLDLASLLLPKTSYLRFGILSHIHLHSKSQKAFSARPIAPHKHSLSRFSLLAIIDSLESTVKRLTWRGGATEWADYYDFTNYKEDSFEIKKNIVAKFIEKIKPKKVWDLGANNGLFSCLASERGVYTVAFDIDPSAVEYGYLSLKKKGGQNLLPLVMDIVNPSPSLGWHQRERDSLIARGPVDMVFALALIHHVAIGNNVPFEKMADFFADISRHIVIEFVPKEDSQVQKLLASRKDVFINYNQKKFEQAFSRRFTVLECHNIAGSKRILYLMVKK